MLTIVLVLSLVAEPNSYRAMQNGMCSALTASEIEAATGAKPGQSQPTDMEAGKGQRVIGCLWSIPSAKGQIALSTGQAPPGTNIKQLMSSNAGVDALKAQHYTNESKEFAGGMCYAVAPPSGLKNGIFMSSCGTIVKGTIVSIAFMSPTKQISMDQTKTLLDKASARQH